MPEATLVDCYNKGCGKKFDATSNSTGKPFSDFLDFHIFPILFVDYFLPEDCQYHPGPPFFHDAYKIWNCCNKKSTDFGTWLSYPGESQFSHVYFFR